MPLVYKIDGSVFQSLPSTFNQPRQFEPECSGYAFADYDDKIVSFSTSTAATQNRPDPCRSKKTCRSRIW